ncbi:MAG TPA: efflux RND transporter periplasmic adaptor subunit [Vicinamibacterales bacterium]|nr:efflux RND transporter periplasmic adaptor subunit [Vicinamibacterales bacterium]
MTRAALTLIVVAAIVAAACSTSRGERTDAKPEAKTPKDQVVLSADEQAAGKIETQPVEATDAPVLLRVSGRIARADDRTWRVGVRTNGLLRSVPVNVGDAVKKDQVLARYHADEVREERAKYRTAASELQRLEAAAALAKRNYDRAQSLLELKAASALQVDQARQDMVAADAAVKNARIEVERTTDVLEDDLRVPVEPKAGNEDADLVPILSPAAGYVLEKNVTPGRTIAPGQDAFVIGDLSEVWMLASVRQDDLGGLRAGQPAVVTLPGLDNERFDGTITNLGQELDPATRVMPVRIVLKNPGQRLRPEMLANAEIPIGRRVSVLTIASDAVQQINGQDIVFVRTAPDRFTVRPVRVGTTSDRKTPILEGLAAGEQVVVRGSFVLKSHLLRSTMESD